MNVAAFKTPEDPAWRWRIVNYAGETIAESSDRFTSIGAALAGGNRHLAELKLVDNSQPVNWRRSTSYLRGKGRPAPAPIEPRPAPDRRTPEAPSGKRPHGRE
jgi:hypothetical protein